ncbi:dethiobiotin synthase [Lawsonia intracellularis]|uniref:dethiobiotin synthase n=1 Tax=Lawsonia intracellularis TaxID=29546 RepID=UPI0009774529|nr:dethiobiotin synthase [Lawsonia intracellularis]KAA0205345.1 dethiobiotin synthase [Lawsonia intracellularis]OMQ04607.1 dethiobiotin synthase [Lawsonia intracellularis]RBN33676.1 dethiobiotin synthase [Lawsonia intracellularis]RBN34276.1 dethiobiotin synthase [Lawsonia intracellularis]UYH53352.1 dethiobiotin synthase [Lawsonia intracellularis]
MQFFIIGTDTNVGKTIVSSWLCLHTAYDYFKMIQTGSINGTDSDILKKLTYSKIHKEAYCYKEPLSPHLAAKLEQDEININNIILPNASNLVIEGAGGLLVPINQQYLLLDIISYLMLPVILVTHSRLGTINHTLLTLQALKSKGIEVVGVIVNGKPNQDNCDAITWYGKTTILAQFPFLSTITKTTLRNIPLTQELKQLFMV